MNKHRGKKKTYKPKKSASEEGSYGWAASAEGPWDISWHLLAPRRATIIICGPPSNQEKWHIWPKGGSWFSSTLVLFPVSVPRAAFNLWEAI